MCSMISSCIRRQSCTLQDLSVSEQESTIQAESQIKRAKRWLSSKWTDWESFYAPYIRPVLDKIARRGELILVIDGSEMAGDCTVLMVSVVWRKYAIPLAWMTKKGEKGHFPEQTHLDLLEVVASIIPSTCRVVLLGDGEFDGRRLCERCEQNNWEFALRTSLDRKIEDHDETLAIGKLKTLPGQELIFIESALDGYNAILWHYQEYESPIPLLTNMELGEMACAYYEHRFKIELMFKQFKSAGFNVHKSKLEGEKRVHSLVIVLALAFIMVFWVGIKLTELPTKKIATFARIDRLTNLTPINFAFKALNTAHYAFNKIFSDMSKNIDHFFSASG